MADPAPVQGGAGGPRHNAKLFKCKCYPVQIRDKHAPYYLCTATRQDSLLWLVERVQAPGYSESPGGGVGNGGIAGQGPPASPTPVFCARDRIFMIRPLAGGGQCALCRNHTCDFAGCATRNAQRATWASHSPTFALGSPPSLPQTFQFPPPRFSPRVRLGLSRSLSRSFSLSLSALLQATRASPLGARTRAHTPTFFPLLSQLHFLSPAAAES